MLDFDNGNFAISYCPYQKCFHIEAEKEYFERTFDVFRRTAFEGNALNGCAYVLLKIVKGHNNAYKQLRQLIEMVEEELRAMKNV